MSWMMDTPVYYWLLIRVIPYIRFSVYYTSFQGWKYNRGYRLLKPGDILVMKDRKKLTGLLIPGEFCHAALCVSKDGLWEVSEMTHHDYTKSCFFDLCKEADRLVILRCKDFDQAYIDNVLIPTCHSLVDAKYDVEFDLGVVALYCSELVYQSDKDRRLQVNLEDIEGLGRPYISPTGLYQAKNCEVIWDSDEEIVPGPHFVDGNGK